MLRSKVLPIVVVVVSLCAVGLIVSGCGDDKSTKKSSKAKSSKGSGSKADRKPEKEVEKKPEVDRSMPTMQTVLTTDSSAENAFTVKTPKGWTSAAVSTGDYDIHREIVTTVSPDGGTMMFLSDPNSPNYWNPATAGPILVKMAENLDYMELRAYEPATKHYEAYAREKFGKLDDFKLTSAEIDQKSTQKMLADAAAAGSQIAHAEVTEIRFTYSDNGTDMEGLLSGYTMDGGDYWVADVGGISTDRSVDDYHPMLEAMAGSRVTRPEYLQRRSQENDTRMADIERKGAEMMASSRARLQQIQVNAERHQERQTDQMNSFYERMDANDKKNHMFSNLLLDEKTVQTPEGNKYQVDYRYDRYYMSNDGKSYLGGNSTFDESSIREMGLDPSNYQFAPVKAPGHGG